MGPGKSPSTEPLLNLLPNIFRKDLKNMGDPLTVAISLGCLSRLCTEDLAQILYKDLIPLYAASKSLVRRKVSALSCKVFIHCPDAIPELIPHLCDRLRDSKTGVQISAVTAIHEISRLNPRLFLVAIPNLFELLNTTKSNWLIIKLIKLVRSFNLKFQFIEFLPVEPRLYPKLRQKYKELLIDQRAKSVEFELIKAVVCTFKNDTQDDKEVQNLAREKL